MDRRRRGGVGGRLAVTGSCPTGLHVFPTFVLYELSVLLVLTLSVVVMKVRLLPAAQTVPLVLSSCATPVPDPRQAHCLNASVPLPRWAWPGNLGFLDLCDPLSQDSLR